MSNLNDIINLAKADGGKFFVMDESGEAKLVIMGIEDYQKMLLGKLQKQVLDVEKVNREITKAQLQEAEVAAVPPVLAPKVSERQVMPRFDMREEVIDPSFDFEGPKLELDDI